MATGVADPLADLQAQPALVVRKHRSDGDVVYDVTGPGGQALVARLAHPRGDLAMMRAPITITAGDGQVPLGAIRVAATSFAVDGPDGSPVGTVARSRRGLRTARWQADQPGVGTFTGRLTGVKRLLAVVHSPDLENLFLPFTFRFSAPGQPGFRIRRRWGFRDRYAVAIANPRIDRRLVLGQLVALSRWEK